MKNDSKFIKVTLGNVMKDVHFSERDRQKVLLEVKKLKEEKSSRPNIIVLYKKHIAAAIIFCLFISMLITFPKLSPTLANTLSSLPFIESIFKAYGDGGLKKGKDSQLVSTVVATSKSNEAEMTIEEAIYDGERISFSYVVESKEPIRDYQIDNLNVSFKEEGRIPIGKLTQAGKYEMVTANKVAGIGTVNFIQHKELPKNIEVHPYYAVVINGKYEIFQFEFKLTKTENVETITPMITRKNKESEFTVKEIKRTPITTVVNMSFKRPLQENDDKRLMFQLITNEGEVVPYLDGFIGGTKKTDMEVMNPIQESFEGLDEKNTDSVTIQPMIANTNWTYNPIEKPFRGKDTKLDLGELGEINIIGVKYTGNVMTLTYELNSQFPFLHSNYFTLKDHLGKVYYGANTSKTFKEKDHYIVEEEFMNIPKKELMIEYIQEEAPEILKDLEIEVPLK
ncbi:DUF4179 domain-containing protein [Niallia sp. FSL W8-0635]|uniref:DUF4179 domain-containing protein n=1 Tax=Niallia sp. FSL W8-0635 TaxID=2975337 RepID=UPI0009D0F2E3|nr:Uncharacterised protein [Mycobacteroides abscessus subsp. abscessus]HEO8419257.1 DUF4179 domain-containing protein [Yersinia enterocolitica]